MLKVRGALEPQQVRAIRHLVATAVNGMKPERVSVISPLIDSAPPFPPTAETLQCRCAGGVSPEHRYQNVSNDQIE